MRRISQTIAAIFATVTLSVVAIAPANAIVDQNGNVVGVIITQDGTVYY